MWNIENRENIENKVLEIIEKKMIEWWYRNKYWKLETIEVWNNIFALKSLRTKNIQWFYNIEWKLIFSIYWLIEDFWEWETEEEKFKTGKIKTDKILEKMWYKWYKDNNWHYHMIKTKTNKEISQESLKYYEIFETLGNIQLREFWEEIYNIKWDYWKKIEEDAGIVFEVLPKEERQEYINEMKQKIKDQVETMINFYTLKPLELVILKKHNIISKEEYEKLKDKVSNFKYIEKLIENPVWDYIEWEEKWYKINWKKYKLNTNWITEDELKLYLDIKIINKQDYDLLKDILEKRKIEQEKKKHTEETKKKISGLENDITDNLW